MQVCMSSFSVLGHSLVIYRWHTLINIMLFHSVSVMASTVCTVAQSGQVCWDALQSMCKSAKRQMTGIGSIQFDISLKFCLMVSTCDIMQYHIGLEWSLHGYRWFFID